MEKVTTDISSFENIRRDGLVYVDKTDLLRQLASKEDGRQFFISRPRRFGKSRADAPAIGETTWYNMGVEMIAIDVNFRLARRNVGEPIPKESERPRRRGALSLSISV